MAGGGTVRAFVTGGSGYLGRNLIRRLVARGDDVVALARSVEAETTVAELGATSIRASLDNRTALTSAMEGAGAVFHCAARIGDWGPLAEFRHDNVEGTANVLAAAADAGVPALLHVSTEAVLADGRALHNADETQPIPARPLGPYAISKGEAERLVTATRSDGLRAVVVRPRFIWGGDDTTVLAQLTAAARSGRLAWFGGGRYLTSTCHVANAVEGMLCAAERGGAGKVYFLTDGEPVEFRAFVTAMLATQGVAAPSRSIPRPVAAGAARILDAMWRALPLRGHPPLTPGVMAVIGQEMTVSDARARRELGYAPVITREQGLVELRFAGAAA